MTQQKFGASSRIQERYLLSERLSRLIVQIDDQDPVVVEVGDDHLGPML
jgi:hypothetical protein